MEISLLFETLISNWEIILLFFFVAILYSSVGFVGGSSYLAILALTSLAFTQIRAIALLCNIVVVSSGTLIYAKNGLYNWKKVLPLIVFSVPLAFLGGYIKISQHLFFILLGTTLIIAAFFMWISKCFSEKLKEKKSNKSISKDAFFWRIYRFCFWYGWCCRGRILGSTTLSYKLGYSKKNCCNFEYFYFSKFDCWAYWSISKS